MCRNVRRLRVAWYEERNRIETSSGVHESSGRRGACRRHMRRAVAHIGIRILVDQSRTPANEQDDARVHLRGRRSVLGPATLLRADASRPSPSWVMAALGDSDA
jgi:hypothetical protein